MPHNDGKSWMRRRLESAIRSAFMKAYDTIKVDPEHYLEHLRMAYNLPALTYDGVYSVEITELSTASPRRRFALHMRMAAAEGAGLGMGGLFTMLPDLGILAGITMRMIQKLSLLYGFSYNTEEEEAELWVAAASAAGVDISRELMEKQFVSKFVPRVIQRIAVSASAEIVEKWTARLIPVVSSVIGAGLNYYFVKVWGERAVGHFRQKHLEARRAKAAIPLPASQGLIVRGSRRAIQHCVCAFPRTAPMIDMPGAMRKKRKPAKPANLRGTSAATIAHRMPKAPDCSALSIMLV